MKSRILVAAFAALILTGAACAQEAGSPPPAGQSPDSGNGGGYGQRGGRRGFGGGISGGMGMMDRGVIGTVTEAASDHYTVKTEAGETYTVHFSANTRILKQPAGMRGSGGAGSEGGGQGRGMGRGGYGGNPPEEISASDIKVGDAVGAMGEVDATAKSVGAVRIMLLDPETAKRLEEMEANFGKTWLQGKVTAIDGTKITLTGALDNAPHTAMADQNTSFRKRREPVTLADIQVGDSVRIEGAVNNGVFTATSVSVVGGMMGGERPGGPGIAPPQ